MENIEKFKQLGLNEKTLKAIAELTFTEPTEIQEKSIPLILAGKDVIGQSATGSGKTLAFGSGMIEKIAPGNGVQALILTPTRELAEQVTKALRVFSKYYGLRVLEVYGGVSINPQIDALRKADIVVGTPGRILDHLDRRTLDLSLLRFLVLDEADRMLDMGFIDDVQKIIKECPKERQTLLFSATISPDIEHLGKRYLINPVYVEVESYVDPSKLHQIFYDVESHLKFSLLVHLLKEEKSKLVMVFCNTRRNADLIAKNLQRYEVNAIAIHGGLTQSRRSQIMQNFHTGRTCILVCTDVAARGLDIKGVSHIYNYDAPKNGTEYIHRIGRTARAGNEGKAISLVSPRDFENFRRVCDDLPAPIPREEVPQNLEPLNINFRIPMHQNWDQRFARGGNRDNRYSGNRQRGFHSGRRERHEDDGVGQGRGYSSRSPGHFSRNRSHSSQRSWGRR